MNILTIGAAVLAAYLILRPKKVTTTSSSSEKKQLACAQGEKLVRFAWDTSEEEGTRCVPISETISGPTPSVNLSADGTVICPVCGRQLQTLDGHIVGPPYGGSMCRCGRVNTFSNPNISGVPTNVLNMAGVEIRKNDFFTQKPGGFYK